MSPITKKFFERLRKELELDIPEDAYSWRTHAGYWQRSSGAFTSVICSKSNIGFEIGLFRSIERLIKCPKLCIDYEYGTMVVDCGCDGDCESKKPRLIKRKKVKHNLSFKNPYLRI